MRRILIGFFIVIALGGTLAAPVMAEPANKNTVYATLTCEDGSTIRVGFNGGPVAFHIVDAPGNFIWKELSYVTPTGETGTISRGIQGFSAAPLITCRYTGPVSGNAYTVIGFLTPSR